MCIAFRVLGFLLCFSVLFLCIRTNVILVIIITLTIVVIVLVGISKSPSIIVMPSVIDILPCFLLHCAWSG